MVEGGADELAATDNGDFLVGEVDVVAGEEPEDGGGGGGVVNAMAGEAIDVFLGGNKGGESIGGLLGGWLGWYG